MKKLLITFSVLIMLVLVSCQRDNVTPEVVNINNIGLPSIAADHYFTATVLCTLRLSQGVKITSQKLSFNIAEYRNGMLELKFHQVCMGMNRESNILCNSYSFSDITINNCPN